MSDDPGGGIADFVSGLAERRAGWVTSMSKGAIGNTWKQVKEASGASRKSAAAQTHPPDGLAVLSKAAGPAVGGAAPSADAAPGRERAAGREAVPERTREPSR